MRSARFFSAWVAGSVLFSGSFVALADDRDDREEPAEAPARAELPAIDLLTAARAGGIGVEAEGVGDGRMTVRVTNQTRRKLRVVLPPGLVASGATGQFGGMGGMGGGMGGGMMGGGMGGMGGGMMGGRSGGGMGGRGGMMGGGGRMLTMPPTMGLMMLGRLIMTLVEPTDSWDARSLMVGMSMMGGGMRGMGGMGGMGMGMGGMGGMGGGFRSVPPTDLPSAVIKPGQTRSLATRLVSLNPPGDDPAVAMPAAGERLQLGDISQISNDPKVRKALRRLAEDKAPAIVSQLVLWNVAYKLDWAAIADRSSRWANEGELALARQLAEQLDALPEGESGRLFVAFDAKEKGHEAVVEALDKLFRDRMMLGLDVVLGVPKRPEGPAVGVKVSLVGEPGKPEALVRVAESRGPGEWASMGKFTLPVKLDAEGKPDLNGFGDALAEGVMTRLVRACLVRVKTPAGATTLQVRIDNASPMVLNGLSVIPAEHKPTDAPKTLLGIALSPGRSLAFGVTEGTAEANHLKAGLKLVALDLSAL